MNRLSLYVATGLMAVFAVGGSVPAAAQLQDVAAHPGHVQIAQGSPWGPPYGRSTGYRDDYGAPYGYKPYGVVSPTTVRLRLIARGYYAIRGIHYVPHRPGSWRRGPGARFPGHYVAFARRLGTTYRFHLNPFTGRPYARIRVD